MKENRLKIIAILCFLIITIFSYSCNRKSNYVFIDGKKVRLKRNVTRKFDKLDSASIQIINDDSYYKNKVLESKKKY